MGYHYIALLIVLLKVSLTMSYTVLREDQILPGAEDSIYLPDNSVSSMSQLPQSSALLILSKHMQRKRSW